LRKTEVAVINYGIGNLLSVRRGLECCGARVSVTSEPEQILLADRVVLPGVGAFADGMEGLKTSGLDKVVHELVKKGTPLLGICLGMQMLMDESEEFGLSKGLGLIPGRVIPVPVLTSGGNQQKVPHIGWNELVFPAGHSQWENSLMEEIKPGDAVYFVHSYMALPDNPAHRIADCVYGGNFLAATIARDNVTGCQFHPEKSGEIGLKILRRFLND
jgi:imidazole glycerol-phosphate synthase subunit HisH